MAMLLTTDTDRKLEDVSNELTMLDDEKKCPLSDRLRRGAKPGNDLFEWPVESVGNLPTDDGVVWDGKPVADAELTNNAPNRGMLQGRTTLQRRAIAVGTKAQHMEKPGIASTQSYDHELAMGMIKLKQQVERRIIGRQNSAPEVAGSAGSQTRGLCSWTRTANPVSGNDLPVPDNNLLHSSQLILSQPEDITTGQMNTAMQRIWEKTGRKGIKYSVFCSGPMKNQVTAWMTGVQPVPTEHYFPVSFNGQLSDHKIEYYVDVFVGDWGAMQFEPHSFLPTSGTDGFNFVAVDMQLVKIRPVFGMMHEELANLGGGKRGNIETYWGLEACDPSALFASQRQ